jgi:hypothetical protein
MMNVKRLSLAAGLVPMMLGSALAGQAHGAPTAERRTTTPSVAAQPPSVDTL